MEDISDIKEKITGIYTDPKKYLELSALQSKHAMESLLWIYLKSMSETDKYAWGFTKKQIEGVKREVGTEREKEISLSDGTFRGIMENLEKVGLVVSKPIDSTKKDYKITPSGERISRLLIEMIYSQDVL